MHRCGNPSRPREARGGSSAPVREKLAAPSKGTATPLVRIDVTQGRTPAELTAIADAIHEAIVAEYGIPVRDRFQVLNELPAGRIIAEDAGLGFDRTSGVVMIQIFTQRGRTDAAKQALYRRIAGSLATVGVAGEDVFIGYVENGPQDWSFGFGAAQYLTGELAVPKAPIAV